jgi:hypothetical protein
VTSDSARNFKFGIAGSLHGNWLSTYNPISEISEDASEKVS